MATSKYYSLVARRSALQGQKTAEELTLSDEYTALVDQIEATHETVDAGLGDMSSDADFVGAVREIMPDKGGPSEGVSTGEDRE